MSSRNAVKSCLEVRPICECKLQCGASYRTAVCILFLGCLLLLALYSQIFYTNHTTQQKMYVFSGIKVPIVV